MIGRIFALAQLLILAWVSLLDAAGHDLQYWGEFLSRKHFSGAWYLENSVQIRFRDNMTDPYFCKIEIGPGLRLNQRFKLAVLYRLNPVDNGDGWRSCHRLLIDPTLSLYSTDKWSLDLRARFHLRLDRVGGHYLRLRPALSYFPNPNGRKSSWFVNDEIFLQLDSPGPLDRFNKNRFSAGYVASLGGPLRLTLYYMLFSDMDESGSSWTHSSAICSSIGFEF